MVRSGKSTPRQGQAEKPTEEQLRTALEEMERYKSIVSKSRVLAIVWRVAPGVWPVEFVSDNVVEVLGCTADDLMSGRVTWPGITHPEDVPRLEAEVAAYLKEGQPQWSREYRLVIRSGQTRWFTDRNSTVRDSQGRITRIQGIVHDITERKRAEEERAQYREQLRGLASELSSAEERERRRVAEDLHDQVSQNLGAMSMHLQMLRGADLVSTQTAALEDSLALLRATARSVRTMTFELCPPMLYETGLAPALAWLAEQSQQGFEGRLGFECSDGVPPLPEEVRAFAFRAARELLNNALKHASPQNMRLRLAAEGAYATISVEDDGVGFDPEAIRSGGPGQRGFGLFAVRERARSLGGRLEIDAVVGRGSRLTLVLPGGE